MRYFLPIEINLGLKIRISEIFTKISGDFKFSCFFVVYRILLIAE
jgi:hypothetical protein